MIGSSGPMSSTPMMRETFTDESTQPLLYGLLANADARRYYLLKVEPYDPSGAATVERYFGAGLSRIASSTALWKPRLIEAFNVETNLFSGPLGIGGGTSPTFGAIHIAIGDAPDDDELTDFLYDGRALTLYIGGDPEDGWTWADYNVIFSGLAEEATWDVHRLTLVVRDPGTRLDVPLQKTFYAGTGTDEGGEDLKGKPKPIGYGRPRNAAAVLVDRTYLIYQVHDGTVIGFDAVYDRGDAYTSDGDTSDLRAWTAVSGYYKTDLSKGMFRLGSTPNGRVTCDFRGDSDSGTLREKQGELLRRILKARAGFVDAEIDGAALSALDATSRELSIYVTDPVTVAQVVDEILLPRGFRTFDATGRFTAGTVEIGNAAGTVQAPNIVSLTRERTPLPAYRISLGYARNWTPMTDDDLTTVGLDLDADFATNEYRRVTATDSTVWNPTAQTGAHPRARDVQIDTLWNDEADAQDEVDAMMDLVGTTRDLYTAVCKRIQFRFRAGQTVRLVHPRFGLSGGKLFVIAGIAEATRSGTTTLRLWG